jgi:hypothetical protein
MSFTQMRDVVNKAPALQLDYPPPCGEGGPKGGVGVVFHDRHPHPASPALLRKSGSTTLPTRGRVSPLQRQRASKGARHAA